MKRAILYFYPGWHWDSHTLVLFKANGAWEEFIRINKFYVVSSDWFEIYETLGGSGSGFSPGELRRRVYIGDREYKKVQLTEDEYHNLTMNKIFPTDASKL